MANFRLIARWLCALVLLVSFSVPALSEPGYNVQPDNSVHFAYQNATASSVKVAGDFTDWSTSPLDMVQNGEDWTVDTAPLAEGAHFYKYIVDGSWIPDPANPMGEDDGFSGTNSAFGIGGRDLGGDNVIRIASLNLHTYQEEDALLKLEQIAFAFDAMNIDVAILQEVGEHVSDSSRPNAGGVIKDHLEQLTGDTWHYEWRMAHIGFDVYREGLGILSRTPLSNVNEYELSGGALRRNALAVESEVKGVHMRFCTAHTSWPSAGGDEEVRKLIEFLDGDLTEGVDATLIGGDFNASTTDPQIQRVLAAGFVDVGASVGNTNGTIGDPPGSRIDYQFLKAHDVASAPSPQSVIRTFNRNADANTYQPRVSDHVGLLAIYENPAPQPSPTGILMR
ncbi:endonuclease/exonuclease/phosphatase family protein [bacterium]|nr:endonuclease/exonuclease/phosphatase family protein [bacterium]